MSLDDVDPVTLAEWLSRRPPTDAYVAAARAAVDVSEARWDRDHALAEAGTDVASGARGVDRDARQMWEARAETDGPDSRAAAKAEELAHSPGREPGPGAAYDDTTQAVIDEARRWAADRDADRADADRAAEAARAAQAMHDAHEMALWERAAEDDDADDDAHVA